MQWMYRTLLFLLFTAVSFAGVNRTQVLYVVTNPSGSCGNGYITVNLISGDISGCISGTWTVIASGGAGGSVTSVQGTTNQLNPVAATTGPVVISFTNPTIFPGPVTTTQLNVAGSGAAEQDWTDGSSVVMAFKAPNSWAVPIANQALVCASASAGNCTWGFQTIGSGTVTTTGSPSNGNLAFFSGPSSITNGTALPNGVTATTQALGDNSPDVATDSFVQAALSVFNPGLAMAAATTAVLPSSPTYSNGTAGVGATLTSGSATTLTIDGYSVQNGDVILVNNQASALQNGVYDATIGGSPYVLTRDALFNTASNINTSGALPILNGSTNNNKIAILNTAITTIGTDAINYTLTAPTTTATPHSVTFAITGGGSTITTGATNAYAVTPTGGTSGIYQVVTTGTATAGPANCSITADVWKRNAAIPSSSQKISASDPATLSTAQYSSDTGLSGWAKGVKAGDVWSVSVASVTGCVSATVQVFYR